MLIRTTLILFSLLSQADIWLETPSGFYVLSLDSFGNPINIPAPNITGYELMGDAPEVPTDPPTDPTNPPPTVDQWGLVALSAAQANLVVGDNDRDGNASKLFLVYTEIGKKVQKNIIADNKVAAALDVGFRIALGGSVSNWTPWKDSIGEDFNKINFANSQQRGQALIDIGIGVGSTSNAAITDWTKLFIDVILPKIISGASFIEILFAIIQELF